MFIYRFIHPHSHQQYIGKWCNSISSLLNRYRVEIKSSTNNRYIVNVLRQIGLDNFKFEIIKDNIDSHEELNSLEKYFISFYDSMKYGYNLTEGGEGVKLSGSKNGMFGKSPWIKGKKHSQETRQQLSESHKGQIPWNKGLKGVQKHSEESKKKLSLANKGKSHPSMKGREPWNKNKKSKNK